MFGCRIAKEEAHPLDEALRHEPPLEEPMRAVDMARSPAQVHGMVAGEQRVHLQRGELGQTDRVVLYPAIPIVHQGDDTSKEDDVPTEEQAPALGPADDADVARRVSRGVHDRELQRADVKRVAFGYLEVYRAPGETELGGIELRPFSHLETHSAFVRRSYPARNRMRGDYSDIRQQFFPSPCPSAVIRMRVRENQMTYLRQVHYSGNLRDHVVGSGSDARVDERRAVASVEEINVAVERIREPEATPTAAHEVHFLHELNDGHLPGSTYERRLNG